ncbi:hypothetical protein PIROE2DRAFT_11119 [Piromyces sp. E2]|nr:hypothetical protein PIROE2DRAFT_11119 [Piromyces sp. E2]|eukprot:OUM62541.1 hypothetical protein PIROE2DRAFT_11119 [Piromyces sp. E2]
MAIIGNPKYIFLDEPTTGLDPLSRRKNGISDILADRKVIISKGKIRCLGTSLFLKNHFYMSYNLDVETTN